MESSVPARGASAARWALLIALLAGGVGSLVAFFLWSLDRMTELRWQYPWLLWLLPVAGVAVVWIYRAVGGASDGGNNLIIDEIHQPGGGVPRRMAPLVLFGTLVTHLFGGSAGREGTAVQMGGAVAGGLVRHFRLDDAGRQLLLTCGVAAGFGAVFGTPLAGTVFALEVVAFGRLRLHGIGRVLASALLADYVCHAWGVGHTPYRAPMPGVSDLLPLLPAVLLASVAFGLAARLFSALSHGLSDLWKARIPAWWLRPIIAGGLVIGITLALGTTDYLGLGVQTEDGSGTSIVNAFSSGSAIDPFGWWWKLLLTAITVSAGFKGGEVTPLFFIGATLGHAIAAPLGLPVDLFAALGFVAVFAGATNTPFACTIMGAELFGAEGVPLFALACFVSYIVTGNTGIYLSQRVGRPKLGTDPGVAGASLRDLRKR